MRAIDAIQLSILGSDPSLIAGGTDFSRFAFAIDTAALPGFIELVPLSQSGVGLLAVIDPLGPFLSPTAGPIDIGTLSVDLAGLPIGSNFLVSLGGALGGLGTDAGGTVDGAPITSFAADTAGMALIDLAEPGGVTVMAAVPEPGVLTLVGVSALCLLGNAGSRRLRS